MPLSVKIRAGEHVSINGSEVKVVCSDPRLQLVFFDDVEVVLLERGNRRIGTERPAPSTPSTPEVKNGCTNS